MGALSPTLVAVQASIPTGSGVASSNWSGKCLVFAASSVVAGVIVRASFWSGSPQGALAHQSTSDTAPSNMSREFTFSDWHQSAGLAVEAPRVLDVRVDVWADDFWQESAEVPGQVRPWPPDWQKSHLWLNGSRTESGHTYPVSKASFERSFYPPSQEWLCRWRRLVDALNAGHNATMCVVGGSMTAGHGVNHKKGETWTQHVAVWLRATFPGWSLSVENRAVPAQSAGELANFHADKLVGCDAYVIDTGVNARRLQTLGMVQAGEDSLLHLLTSRSSRAAAQPPPILYAHAFDFCFGQCGCEKNSEAVEVLRDYKGRAFCPSVWQWALSDHEAQVARFHGLAVASFRSVIWPVYGQPPSQLLDFWNDRPHPTQVTHALYADVIKYGLAQLLLPGALLDKVGDHQRLKHRSYERERSLLHTCASVNVTATGLRPFFRADSDMRRSCAARVAYSVTPVSEVHTYPPLPSAVRGNWTWATEVGHADRFGWVGRFTAGTSASADSSGEMLSISFVLRFSKSPRLDISVLRSYEGFLDARVRLSGPGCATQIDDASDDVSLCGSWDERLSVPEVTSWDRGPAEARGMGSGLAIRPWARSCSLDPSSNYTLTIIVVPPSKVELHRSDRFKLIDVRSC